MLQAEWSSFLQLNAICPILLSKNVVYDSFSGEGVGGDLLRCLELTTFQSEAGDGGEGNGATGGGDVGGGGGVGEREPSMLRQEKLGISGLPTDMTLRLPEVGDGERRW